MTRALLDTHALLWAIGDPDRLSARARAVIEERSSGVFVSAASAWEIATKVRLGKLPGFGHVVSNFRTYLARLEVTPLPIADEHALLAGTLEWARRDPFDRMLAAQALTEGFALLSSDAAFAEIPGLSLVW